MKSFDGERKGRMKGFGDEGGIGKRGSLSALAVIGLGVGAVLSGQEVEAPNIIYIMADDAGYADIEPFGSKTNRTPHLTRMANEGMRLTSHYAAPVCTPARAKFLTGSYAQRVGLSYGSYTRVLRPGDPHGLNPEEITIAKILRGKGYATGVFGKWHLGDQPEFMPHNHGFDEYFGIPYSNNHWPLQANWDHPRLPLMRNGVVVGEVKTMEDQAQLCHLEVEAAIEFIRENRDRPFFAYIPHVFPHFPRRARQEFMERADTVTQAQIEELDWALGRIFETLGELGLEKRTLVFWVSDNGGERGSSNAPLRGNKGDSWEGGIRVPAIAWWPGRIPAGGVSDEVTSVMDMLPTFARLAGGEPPRDRMIDGHDIRPVLFGEPGAASPYEAFFYYSRDGELHGVRSGQWKLRLGELYDLDADIGETRDLSDQYPDVVAKLEGYLQGAMADLGDARNPGPNVRPVGIAPHPRTILPRPGLPGDLVVFPYRPWPARPEAPNRPMPRDAYAPTGDWSNVGQGWMICPVCLFQGNQTEHFQPGVPDDPAASRSGHLCPVCTDRLRPLPKVLGGKLQYPKPAEMMGR